MTYRGVAGERWSSTYNLTGSTPADSAAWRTLFDLLVTQEKVCYSGTTSVVAGYGYNIVPVTGTSAIWSVDLTQSPNTPVAGTLSGTSGVAMAGDQASWIRWGLDRLNTKGKRIYLRKYMHGGFVGASGGDTLSANTVTALNALGAKLRDGSFVDARVITDRTGAALLGHGVSSFVTTRTLKRRGKRPTP